MKEIQSEIKPASIQGLLRQTRDRKIEKDKQGRLIDAVTGERLRYVIFANKAGVKVYVPGQTFKDARGTEYMVMPSASIRRLTPRKGE